MLQIGALLATTLLRPAAPGPGATVLCVGDSYTYGIGASAPAASYPARLQADLRARGIDAGVANGGCPGHDSAYVLRRLPALLRPDTKVVCVMLGTNDGWSRPARVDASELQTASSGGFELRWRTGRLLALLFRFAGGTWTRTGDAATTPDPPDARVERDLVDPDAGFALLVARGVIPREPVPIVTPPPCAPEVMALVARAQQLLASDPAAALVAANDAARAHPESPQVLCVLAQAAHAAGNTRAAQRAFARLRTLAATGEPAAVECEVLALAATDQPRETMTRARDRVAAEPAAVFAWHALQEAAFVLGEWDEFARAAAATLRLAGRASAPRSATIARHYAHAIAGSEPEQAAALLVAATLLDGDVGLTRVTLAKVRAAVPWPHFANVLAAVAATHARAAAALRARFEALYAGDDDGAWTQILRDHLRVLGEFAVRRGARVVVLSYPFFQPQVEEAQRAAAEALGATFVLVRERFDRELRTRPRSDLFVRDGHCNDAGYAIVAELAADAVQPLLR